MIIVSEMNEFRNKTNRLILMVKYAYSMIGMKTSQNIGSLRRSISLLAGYLITIWLVNLFLLTIVSFFYMRSKASIPKIADFIMANRLPTCSVAAILFVLMLQALRPLTKTKFEDIFKFESFHFSNSFHFMFHGLQGIILASVLIAGGLVAGHFSWLGLFMRFDEVVLSFATALIFSFGIFAMVTFEEFLMRKVLEPQFRRFGGTIAIQSASCVIYVLIKYFQFDLTIIEMLNFVLLNLVFYGIARNERSHISSAIFASTFLIALHSIFSLPFLGQDIPGIFVLRAVEGDSNAMAMSSHLGTFLSGGLRGPENSFILTILLGVYISLPWMRTQISKKKTTSISFKI